MSVCQKNQQQHARSTCPFKGRLGHAENETWENYIARTHCVFLYFCWICFENDTIVSWINRLTSNAPFEKAAMVIGSATSFAQRAASTCTPSEAWLSRASASLVYLPCFKHAVSRPTSTISLASSESSTLITAISAAMRVIVIERFWKLVILTSTHWRPGTVSRTLRENSPSSTNISHVRAGVRGQKVKGWERERHWSSQVAWQGVTVPWQGEHRCAWNERAFSWIQWSRGLWAPCCN